MLADHVPVFSLGGDLALGAAAVLLFGFCALNFWPMEAARLRVCTADDLATALMGATGALLLLLFEEEDEAVLLLEAVVAAVANAMTSSTASAGVLDLAGVTPVSFSRSMSAYLDGFGVPEPADTVRERRRVVGALAAACVRDTALLVPPVFLCTSGGGAGAACFGADMSASRSSASASASLLPPAVLASVCFASMAPSRSLRSSSSALPTLFLLLLLLAFCLLLPPPLAAEVVVGVVLLADSGS
mmetsp:Transcript_6224/g.10672  ORF Transcript_6224/g.10672 Transcript_6224/m.10672 type:complete len:245 (+) Transcript_6224:498-1232(+)